MQASFFRKPASTALEREYGKTIDEMVAQQKSKWRAAHTDFAFVHSNDSSYYDWCCTSLGSALIS
jgi:hypothetical protein